jgi:hypothetical protein
MTQWTPGMRKNIKESLEPTRVHPHRHAVSTFQIEQSPGDARPEAELRLLASTAGYRVRRSTAAASRAWEASRSRARARSSGDPVLLRTNGMRCWSQSVSMSGWECSSEASAEPDQEAFNCKLALVVGQVTDFGVVYDQFQRFAAGAHRCCGQRREALRRDRLGAAQKTRTRSVPTRRRNSGRRRRPS